MGPCHAKRGKGNNAKNKHFRKYVLATKHRARDLDQIRDDLDKRNMQPGNGESNKRMRVGDEEAGEEKGVDVIKQEEQKFDEDLPAGGLYYCVETARYFVSQDALNKHKSSKQFKQRVKELIKEKKYTQEDADLAAGLKKEKLSKVSGGNNVEMEVAP